MRFLYFILLSCLLTVQAVTAAPSAPANNGMDNVFDNIGSSSATQFLPVAQAFRAGIVNEDAQQIELQFDIAPEYYLYRHRLKFALDNNEDAIAEVILPEGLPITDEFFGDVEVYYTSLKVILKPAAGVTAKQLTVEYQGCADAGLCYPPETIRFDLAAASSDESPSSINKTLWWSTLLLFAAGLALTFTPCVLPMVPILTGMVLGRENINRSRALILSISYVLGMALTFAFVGALIGLFGAALNIQARLQSPWVLGTFAIFFVLFALAMFDVFNLRLPAFLREPAEQLNTQAQGGSIVGAAVMGALSSLVVSPCISAPLAGALVYISSTGDAAGGALQLFALALGMGLPLILVAVFGSTLLPRSGPWMNSVKQAFGIGMLAVAIWLLERFIPGSLSLTLWAALAAGVAVQLGLFQRNTSSGWGRTAQALGFMLAIYSAAALIGALSGGSDPLQPLRVLTTSSNSSDASYQAQSDYFTTVTTSRALEKQLTLARDAGQPAIIELSADWCISCKIMERDIINHPSVRPGLDDMARIRFDVTDNTSDQRAWLTDHQLFGPPAFLFHDSKGTEVTQARIQGEVKRATFLEHLQRLKAAN